MFLSTENPPNDPLSSSSSPPFLHLPTSSHELGQSHLSNFSIRDYAYSNRKNNIKNNWPFSSKSLQLFSTHGITDPLPPLQKVSTVSNQFETKASSSSGKQIVSYVHHGRDLAKLGLNQTLAETSKGGVSSQSRIIENGLFSSTSVSKSEVEIVVAATSNKKDNHSKKCGRGMVKSKEDSCGGLVTTSESIMASKTCPICKTFSSASNTTLNAHIDQCLSVDSALPPVVSSKPNKPRSKPRVKVKTMVDIYASAKEGTLEDLDKRNGTKWVSILSYTNRVVAEKSEVSKKRKVSPVGVGPVYIDAKGQKLRILSEFSEKKTSTTPSREQHEDGSGGKKCLSQGSKGNNKCLRKIRRVKKPHKYVKLTNHKANAPEQIPGDQRGFSGEGSHTGHHRIHNQRMLAKRGLISKKLNEKGHELYGLRDQLSDDEDTWSGGDPTVLRGTDLFATDSYPLYKQKLGSEVARPKKALFGSKSAQSRSFRVPQSEKEDESLEGIQINTLRLKKSIASFQEDKYPPGKNFCSDAVDVSDASPRGTSMRKFSPPFVPNAWRRLSVPVELNKARLDFSEEEDEEETGKWESEMTQERELPDNDYVSGDNGERNEVLLRSNPSSSGYDDYNDDDDESSEEEEANNKRAHVLDKTDDMGAEFYQSDSPPSIEILPRERAMYYSEVGNMIYGQTSCKENERFDSVVGQGSLFVEVDTIPIPGPPGSFLPSPRDMGFDENLGNSSVITSQVQSSMDQLDRNSSESPVSAVSNFAAGRLNFPAELSSTFRENFSPDIAMSYSTTSMSFCVPSHHGTTEAEPITIDKTTLPSRFRNNDQESCCCQRKERISEGITRNHQGSHLLQRRAASSSITMNLTNSPTRLDPNHPFEQSPYKIQQALDLQSKFSSRTNPNAVVPPSPSNPVLRLMGKDLMVMNQGEADEEASRSSLTPTPQFVDPPCGGTGLYFNTGLYLRNSFESTQQPQAQTQPQPQPQAAAFRNNFDHVRYFSPS
ncbi:uncharacterized protein LOC9302206 isoform X1 [Arabidopsis lyrata subsp. lyrata]|uniref:uncharacterized protein LOC9302206 isoform X1 n=1 Tax=Arabidopsis lyrata subsp. lyrata TaxID=81972 RepID=UPI000A29C983|nr:uncharacterized protein LOC9302206 isoform X1 [Arabidopsis lyrata subsp. lyrata]XP_020886098.1 uncharacterized protein LOC9302206 isoform X1 [Arabidopsis lyrata subsp. lyrata]|eukprot:XP_020886093.1 uncharacterized protein LOC9302206 isoform X1 [Arabidopsis lyrata subsp. lyrata]